jgi:hypothetical protein
MKVNYVLLYGTPYLKHREFETFEDISKFLVNKSIVNYSIFKKLEDEEEVEMIYRDNDIRYLENENNRLNNIINELEKDIDLELYKTRENNEYNEGLFNAFRYIKDKLEVLKELKEGK